MPPESKSGHLFLSPITSSRSHIWYKSDINVGEGMIRTWMKTIARNIGLSGDITNKSGRVTSITRMMAARVPPEVISQITGHRNLKTLAMYDKVAILKAQAAQELLRQPHHPDTGQILTFQYHYDKVMGEYHGWQLSKGSRKVSAHEEAESLKEFCLQVDWSSLEIKEGEITSCRKGTKDYDECPAVQDHSIETDKKESNSAFAPNLMQLGVVPQSNVGLVHQNTAMLFRKYSRSRSYHSRNRP